MFLGLCLDSELNMRAHIWKVRVWAFPSTQTTPAMVSINTPAMQRLPSAFFYPGMITAMVNLHFLTIAPWQRIIYAATRLVAGLEPRDRVTLTFRELHWLLVVYRIRYTMCVITHAVVRGESPAYVNEVLMSNASIPVLIKLSFDGLICIRCATTWNHRQEGIVLF